jgi:hypothetical protein
MSFENIPSEDQGKNNTETPLKVEKLIFIAGKYRLVPMTINEAISQSAKRVKILPNGKRILDTTNFQEKVKRIFHTEVKISAKENDLSDIRGKNLLSEITEAGKEFQREDLVKSVKRKVPKTCVKRGKKVKDF